jgi:hypothetical protein
MANSKNYLISVHDSNPISKSTSSKTNTNKLSTISRAGLCDYIQRSTLPQHNTLPLFKTVFEGT